MDHFITKYDIEPPAGAERAVLEDSIMHKGRLVTAGSKILESFISPLDATVVTKLEAAGVAILGKTRMSEFGAEGLFADTTETVIGAVSAVADGVASFALCNDYTGAVAQKAAGHGQCYIRPTYGTVSRYGLIPAVPSMDQIGIVCRNPADGFRVLEIIAGHDPKDGAMFADAVRPDAECGVRNAKSGDEDTHGRRLRFGAPANVFSQLWDAAAVSFIGIGAGNIELVEFELKYFDVFAQVMQILCCAELSNNITRYDGIKFGYRAGGFTGLRELYLKSRTEAFGPDAKLAAMLGAMVLSQENYLRYYDKAMRVRRLIKESLEFDKYDAIILPAGTPPCAALPQLCGLPAATVPFGSGGITLIADARREDILKSALEAVGL